MLTEAHVKPSANERPIYVVRLQPMPGTDPIKAVRWLLKAALRLYGLRCLSVREEPRAAEDNRTGQ